MNLYQSLRLASCLSLSLQRPIPQAPLLAQYLSTSPAICYPSPHTRNAERKPKRKLTIPAMAAMNLEELSRVIHMADKKRRPRALKEITTFARVSTTGHDLYVREKMKGMTLTKTKTRVAKKFGKEYKALDLETKRHWQRLAAEVVEKRDENTKEWLKKCPRNIVKEIFRYKLLPESLKEYGGLRPPTAFDRFLNAFKDSYTKRPGTKGKKEDDPELIRQATNMWIELPEDKKDIYRRLAQRDMDTYLTQLGVDVKPEPKSTDKVTVVEKDATP